MELMSAPGSWPQDFDQENGKYAHLCVYCRREFMGNKHRAVCKECQDKQDAEWKAELKAAFNAGGQRATFNGYPGIADAPDFEEWFKKTYESGNDPKPIDTGLDSLMQYKNYDHLRWIYSRLVNLYGENPNMDYMVKLKDIIDRKS